MSKQRLQSNPLLQKNTDKQSKQGLQEGYTRATFIIRDDLLQSIKEYAYWERTTIKEVLEQIITDYNNKVIIPAIKKHKGGKHDKDRG